MRALGTKVISRRRAVNRLRSVAAGQTGVQHPDVKLLVFAFRWVSERFWWWATGSVVGRVLYVLRLIGEGIWQARR